MQALPAPAPSGDDAEFDRLVSAWDAAKEASRERFLEHIGARRLN
jgi:hypothetical protein